MGDQQAARLECVVLEGPRRRVTVSRCDQRCRFHRGSEGTNSRVLLYPSARARGGARLAKRQDAFEVSVSAVNHLVFGDDGALTGLPEEASQLLMLGVLQIGQ